MRTASNSPLTQKYGDKRGHPSSMSSAHNKDKFFAFSIDKKEEYNVWESVFVIALFLELNS